MELDIPRGILGLFGFGRDRESIEIKSKKTSGLSVAYSYFLLWKSMATMITIGQKN